ncbi:MAG: hypothetical protein ACFFG0_06320 [Candidatus Thorarchaeota archaeon]
MACDKGYKGECCCECEYQLKIHVCSCPICSKVEGYICILFRLLDGEYLCHHKISEHGACECFIKKQPNKAMNQTKGLQDSPSSG